ncbi:hypothetical protein ACJIZ3_003578 [Penstemon smallii]|uniref:DYW domain-containing protein n=1 Tax=Penstemon smallii TaxID=265156 RepID=A0ABD3UCQ5_9LAMI
MKACGDGEALEMAKSVHAQLLTIGNIDVDTYNKIHEMYSKCDSMDDALKLFNQMSNRDLMSWNTMIFWLAKNDFGENSIELFAEFKKRSGVKPYGQMFIGIFYVCGGLCDTIQGMLHFESMVKDYGIVPSMKHYVSLVDMLRSARFLDEALKFIEKMPIKPSVDTWETLMKYCKIHGNSELGNRCDELVEHLDSSRLNEQSREDVSSKVHGHTAGDKSQPDSKRIYALLAGLKEHMKEGCLSYRFPTHHDVDEDTKEEQLMHHFERLTIAEGFLMSAARSKVGVLKNIATCGDCHAAFKIVSKIVGRQIIARDKNKFHYFENGSCPTSKNSSGLNNE